MLRRTIVLAMTVSAVLVPGRSTAAEYLQYKVLTPPDYATSSRSYPVVYAVPGSTETPESWTSALDLQSYANRGEALVVVVSEVGDGKSNFIVDWFDGSKPLDTSFVALVHTVDAGYRTLAGGDHRAIFGASAGGYSATAIASRHPDMFAAVASFSGVTDIVFLGLPWELTLEAINTLFSGPDGAMRRWGNPVTDEAYWRANNPADLAANLAGKGVYITSGDGTPTRTEEVGHGPGLPIEMAIEHVTWQMTRSYDEKLTAAEVQHEFRPRAGIHTPDYWRTDLSLWWPTAIDVITSPLGDRRD